MMKVNFSILEKDCFGEIVVKHAPGMIKTQAEQILTILSRTAVPPYNKVTDFDKELTYQYWKQIDAMPCKISHEEFRLWFRVAATYPELIRRARQWLVEHNYLIPTKKVAELSQSSSSKWRGGIKG